MKKTYILLSIVFAVIVLFAASEVRAGGTTPYPLSPGVAVPPRDCTIDAGGGVKVHIEAGPADLSPQFPLAGMCGPTGGPYQPCLRWIYRWTVTGTNASLVEALVSVDSDITVLDAKTPVHISKILGIVNVGEAERFLDFPTSGTKFVANYSTPANATPGTLTAGFIGKKGLLPLVGRCQLAGANNVVLQPNQAVADMQTFQTPGCTVAFSVGPDGKVIPDTIQITAGTDNCTTTETIEPLDIDGIPVVYIGSAQMTLQGSCSYCWVNTSGGKTCTTCKTCCISNATGKCVAISSIVYPDVCRP